MVKKCIYCGTEVPDESVIDFCDRCGVSVWGHKMFGAIKKQMEDARTNEDLCSTNMNFNKDFKGNSFKHF
jgi:uncharacterized UBP type Zn finger protein